MVEHIVRVAWLKKKLQKNQLMSVKKKENEMYVFERGVNIFSKNVIFVAFLDFTCCKKFLNQ